MKPPTKAALVKEAWARPGVSIIWAGLLLNRAHVAAGETSKYAQFGKRRNPWLNEHKYRRYPTNRDMAVQIQFAARPCFLANRDLMIRSITDVCVSKMRISLIVSGDFRRS